jgi:hypothetical protein
LYTLASLRLMLRLGDKCACAIVQGNNVLVSRRALTGAVRLERTIWVFFSRVNWSAESYGAQTFLLGLSNGPAVLQLFDPVSKS